MRKILFIHDEQCLPGALQDIQDLLNVECRLFGGTTSDLLAILVMSHQLANSFLLQQEPHEIFDFTDGQRLFGLESVSMSGAWTLVTLAHPELTKCSKRNEALVLLLDVLQAQGNLHSLRTVFPVYSSEEDELLIGPPLPLANSISV